MIDLVYENIWLPSCTAFHLKKQTRDRMSKKFCITLHHSAHCFEAKKKIFLFVDLSNLYTNDNKIIMSSMNFNVRHTVSDSPKIMSGQPGFWNNCGQFDEPATMQRSYRPICPDVGAARYVLYFAYRKMSIFFFLRDSVRTIAEHSASCFPPYMCSSPRPLGQHS